MSDHKRIPFASHFATRDSTLTHDGELRNVYEEDTPIGKMVIKRPGQTNSIALGPCVAQGSVFFNGNSYFVCNNVVYVAGGSSPICAASTGAPTVYAEGISADIDPASGNLWLNTTTGHAYLVNGVWTIVPANPALKQIQIWNPVTRTLIAAIASAANESTTFIDGQILGDRAGNMFVGRNAPGAGFGSSYQAGYQYTISTKVELAMQAINTASDFNNAFYWPGVPSILNGLPYMVGENGASGGLALEFLPPNTAPTAATWHDKPQPNNSVSYPDWGFISYLFPSVGTLVQCHSDTLNWTVSGSLTINTFSLTSPLISPIVYDSNTNSIWAFTGTNYNQLYQLTSLSTGGSLVNTGYSLPGRIVQFAAYDYGNKALRLATTDASGNLYVTLFDPIRKIVISEVNKQLIPPSFSNVQGYKKAWNIEQCQKLVCSFGNGLYEIPYGP